MAFQQMGNRRGIEKVKKSAPGKMNPAAAVPSRAENRIFLSVFPPSPAPPL